MYIKNIEMPLTLNSKTMSPKSSLILILLTSTTLISFVSSRLVPLAAPAEVGSSGWITEADKSSGAEESSNFVTGLCYLKNIP